MEGVAECDRGKEEDTQAEFLVRACWHLYGTEKEENTHPN